MIDTIYEATLRIGRITHALNRAVQGGRTCPQVHISGVFGANHRQIARKSNGNLIPVCCAHGIGGVGADVVGGVECQSCQIGGVAPCTNTGNHFRTVAFKCRVVDGPEHEAPLGVGRVAGIGDVAIHRYRAGTHIHIGHILRGHCGQRHLRLEVHHIGAVGRACLVDGVCPHIIGCPRCQPRGCGRKIRRGGHWRCELRDGILYGGGGGSGIDEAAFRVGRGSRREYLPVEGGGSAMYVRHIQGVQRGQNRPVHC